jgi:hypothetical protein
MNPWRRPMSTLLHWNLSTLELSGVLVDGMSERNRQRKPETARGWRRRSRTADAEACAPLAASHLSGCPASPMPIENSIHRQAD